MESEFRHPLGLTDAVPALLGGRGAWPFWGQARNAATRGLGQGQESRSEIGPLRLGQPLEGIAIGAQDRSPRPRRLLPVRSRSRA